MKNLKIKKGTLIDAGNFQVSIGTHEDTEVALFSKSSGEFVQLKHIKKGGKLAKIKRKFKSFLNSDSTLTFSHMQPDRTRELIALLKKKN